ncbi:hypothetical protein [Brevundimonas sp.]|jgi:hypothetical protein|uniref:hypothetical protein n=1 Tax=Brevundimonas sp. TaxID=1871086 RepID=UPI001846A795|nr:hypothetical protein [Brevundimonas sp.]MBA4807594.1 hypothetical protein [Brevundimonas sp.]
MAAAISLLAACDHRGVNPPDEPAAPLRTPEAMQQVEPPGPSSLASRGSRSFVGVWAANPGWCANPQGERRPIILTPMRFEGYENRCDIARIDETGSGYVATLNCAGEGQTRSERVHMAASGDVMNLTWIDRDITTVKLARCPGSPRAPDPANPLEKMMKGEGDETPPADPS